MAPRNSKKKAAAKTAEPTTTTTLKGGLTTKERTWAHRIADHKVAAERELGATRRETPAE
jgi:hypothetical protein